MNDPKAIKIGTQFKWSVESAVKTITHIVDGWAFYYFTNSSQERVYSTSPLKDIIDEATLIEPVTIHFINQYKDALGCNTYSSYDVACDIRDNSKEYMGTWELHSDGTSIFHKEESN